MGIIRIEVDGSFKPNARGAFPAEQYGHAQAVADAIKWLAKEVLPAAIIRDHRLHDEGQFPEVGFGDSDQEPSVSFEDK